MTVYDVVNKLIGKINPVGETTEDDKRFENLKAMTELINLLISDVEHVAFHHEKSGEYSRKRAGEFANRFLALQERL